MSKRLYAPSRAARLMAPGPLDVHPHPEGNPAESYAYDARVARAFWGFLLHAYQTGRATEAWHLFDKEMDDD